MDPQLGHEQAGRRPAICLSPANYNRKAGLAIFCPITSQAKGYPFEVEISGVKAIKGVVLADQLKSFDWNKRQFEKIGKCGTDQIDRVLARATQLLKA
jgi:mRNA interferase MazF